jgi:hypothetical protein
VLDFPGLAVPNYWDLSVCLLVCLAINLQKLSHPYFLHLLGEGNSPPAEQPTSDQHTSHQPTSDHHHDHHDHPQDFLQPQDDPNVEHAQADHHQHHSTGHSHDQAGLQPSGHSHDQAGLQPSGHSHDQADHHHIQERAADPHEGHHQHEPNEQLFLPGVDVVQQQASREVDVPVLSPQIVKEGVEVSSSDAASNESLEGAVPSGV